MPEESRAKLPECSLSRRTPPPARCRGLHPQKSRGDAAQLAEELLATLREGSGEDLPVGRREGVVEERLSSLDAECLRRLEAYLTERTGPKHEFYQYWSEEQGFFWEERTGRRFVNPCLAACCVKRELEGPVLFPKLYLEGDSRVREWKRIVPAWAGDVLSRATGLSDVALAAYLCRLADLVYRENAYRASRCAG